MSPRIGIGIFIEGNYVPSSATFWDSIISIVVEDAQPTHVVMTSSVADTTSIAANFTITGISATVISLSRDGTNKILTLTLSGPVVYGNTLNVVKGGVSKVVTNNIVQILPVYVSSAIADATPTVLSMTYNLTLANVVPATSAFTVLVNGVARTVNSVAISTTNVNLTLASAVVYGDVVTVAYTKPGSNPLQVATGGQAVSLSAQTVVNNANIPGTLKLYSYNAGSQVDAFLDDVLIGSSSGVTKSVNKPVKSASNPLFEPAGANLATWDYDKLYLSVYKEGGTYYMWYTALSNTGTQLFICLAESSDGITWTKPNTNFGIDSYDSANSNFDGTNNATAFTDPIFGAWGFVGDAVLSTTQKAFGSTSVKLTDGTGYISMPAGAGLNFGSGNFTIECRVYFTNLDGTNAKSVFAQCNATATASTRQSQIGTFVDNKIGFYLWDDSANLLTSTLSAINTVANTTWYHLALIRNGNTVTLYVNGVGKCTLDVTGITLQSSTSVMSFGHLGVYSNQAFNMKGYIDEIRISKGIARWTANFTPPAISYIPVSNSNLVLGDGSLGSFIYYDADGAADRKYVMVLSAKPGSGGAGGTVNIYKSSDKITWTLIKTLTRAGALYVEGNEIIQRPDGKWIAYYRGNEHTTTDREIGAWLSDSSDLEGTWTDQGIIITTSSQEDQKYSLRVMYLDGYYYGIMCNYGLTSNQIITDLYISRDGLTGWVRIDTGWIPLGAGGSFDDEMILSSNLLKDGDVFYVFYSGSAENHAHTPTRDSRIGLATIPYNRIGQITGSGTLISTAFTPTTGLFLNGYIPIGTIKVELLNAADNTVIAGYSKDDMTALSGDTYSTEVKWGANSILTDRSLKIKFYLT